MNRKAAKKIKKLRKVHVWPSVLFFLLTVILAVGAFVALSGLTMAVTMETYISVADVQVGRVCQSLEEAEGEEHAALKRIQNDRVSVPEAVFVYDRTGSVIAGYGDMTCDRAQPIDSAVLSGIGSGRTLYLDESARGTIIDETSSASLVRRLVTEGVLGLVRTGFRADAVIGRVSYWLQNTISGGRNVLVKCNMDIRTADIIKAGAVGFAGFAVLFLPGVFFFINILSSVHSQRRMTKLLYTDTTTGGSSLMFFEEYVEKRLRASRKAPVIFMIADITLMKYMSYCSYHGVRAGEALLEDIDKALRGCITRREYSAHTGRASFALFLECADKESGKTRVAAILNTLTNTFGSGGLVFHAGVFFSEREEQIVKGKACFARVTDPMVCLNRANAARATLEDENTAGLVIYDNRILDEQRWEHKVEEKMRQALENEEFQVYIQPKYDPATNEIAGAEALVRWINREDGVISPGRFIPIFEKNGFITKLDDYMISHVAQLQAKWLREGRKVVPVSVNVSRAHFADPDLAKHICGLVDRWGVPHGLIEIELTESAFFDNNAILLKIVRELSDMGFEVSMDDFGAGYSSLNSLKDLPLDVLKLDAEFFRGEGEQERGRIVVSEAIALAKRLNMRIVAEGIERKDQVEFLADQGCDMIQGFYYAQPMEASVFEQEL